MPAPDNSRETIAKIAAAQKLLLWAILLSIVVTGGIFAVSGAFNMQPDGDQPHDREVFLVVNGAILLVRIAAIVVQIIAVIRLCLALKEGYATIVYVLSQFVPCLSLLLLVFLNSRATKRLQSCGIRVGLMGAKARDVANYRPSNRTCPGCGEEIDGTVETCSMCGAKVTAASGKSAD